VPTGKLGYFNLLQDFAGATSQWGMQAYFDAGGAGLVDAGGAGAGTFTYAYDTWINVKIKVDLDTDFAEMWVDGNSIVTWVWSSGSFGTGTLNELDAMNLYAWNVGGTPGAIFDDIDFYKDEQIGPFIVYPATVTQSVPPGGTAQQMMNIGNTGGENLLWTDITIEYVTANAGNGQVIDPVAAAEVLAQRIGQENGVIKLGNVHSGAVSPNQTDDEYLRYDDGTNFDAIGLTAGGTFQVSTYYPASTMGQYAGMKLSQVEMYINDVPNPCVIKIYGAGTPTVPGALLHEETVVPTGIA
jgi:hypothetical protein